MTCKFCEAKKHQRFSPGQRCPRCGKLYDESGYLNTAEPHQNWYGMRSGKTRNNQNPNRKELRK